MVSIYCRYREVSPVCAGKNRPLHKEEMTKEHLIPKAMLRNPKMKTLLNISFNPSDAPNVDISCFKCNHLKNHMADVPFVWKLQYLQRYGISLKSQRSLVRTLVFDTQEPIEGKQRDKAIQCVYRGDIELYSLTSCRFSFHKMTVMMEEGKVKDVIQQKEKWPRKLKKKAKHEKA